MDKEWLEAAKAAVQEWEDALEGDSGDREIDAGLELADLVRAVIEANEG